MDDFNSWLSAGSAVADAPRSAPNTAQTRSSPNSPTDFNSWLQAAGSTQAPAPSPPAQPPATPQPAEQPASPQQPASNLSPEQHERNRAGMERALGHYKEKGDAAFGPGTVEYWAESLPVGGLGFTGARAFDIDRASKRIERGEAQDRDFFIVAKELAREEYHKRRSNAGAALDAVVGAAGFAGEAALTAGVGPAAKAGVAKLIGPGVRRYALGRVAAAPAEYGGALAAQTAATPRLYMEPAMRQNTAAGRDLLDPEGLAKSFALANAQMAVLGQIGRVTGRVFPGEGAGAAAGRVATAFVGGPPTQAAVDVATTALDKAAQNVIGTSLGLDTGYGSVGMLLEGKTDDAVKHGIRDAFTFAAFSAAHEVTGRRQAGPDPVVTAYVDALRKMARQGVSRERAGQVLLQPADVFRSILEENPQATRSQVEKAMEGLPEGPARDWGLALARTVREPGAQPEQLGRPEGRVENAPLPEMESRAELRPTAPEQAGQGTVRSPEGAFGTSPEVASRSLEQRPPTSPLEGVPSAEMGLVPIPGQRERQVSTRTPELGVRRVEAPEAPRSWEADPDGIPADVPAARSGFPAGIHVHPRQDKIPGMAPAWKANEGGEHWRDFPEPRATPEGMGLDAARTREPLPLPPGGEKAPDQVKRAWNIVSRLWPEMAGKVKGVRVKDFGERRVRASINERGELVIPKGKELQPESLWHELVHLEQEMQGRKVKQSERSDAQHDEMEREAYVRAAQMSAAKAWEQLEALSVERPQAKEPDPATVQLYERQGMLPEAARQAAMRAAEPPSGSVEPAAPAEPPAAPSAQPLSRLERLRRMGKRDVQAQPAPLAELPRPERPERLTPAEQKGVVAPAS